MGRDKALLPFGGFQTLTQYQFHRLQKIFDEVYISTKSSHKFPFQAPFIEDDADVFAPTAAFVAVMKQLGDRPFFVLGVDMPFVSDDIIGRVIEADSENVDATLCRSQNGAETLCGVYHPSLKEEFEDMLRKNEHKLRRMLETKRVRYVECDQSDAFLNLNKPHEYQKAQQLYDIIN